MNKDKGQQNNEITESASIENVRSEEQELTRDDLLKIADDYILSTKSKSIWSRQNNKVEKKEKSYKTENFGEFLNELGVIILRLIIFCLVLYLALYYFNII